MLIFKSKSFARFAKKAGIADLSLRKAISEAERGLVDADLGGGVIKQRIARPGQGKSGGFRTVILFRASTIAFFVHGFAKKDLANISDEELATLRQLAVRILAFDNVAIAEAVDEGLFIEVVKDEENT